MSARRKERDGDEFIYTPYITVKGKRIYHPNGGVFRIPLERIKRRK
jgi:hypothetical protein